MVVVCGRLQWRNCESMGWEIVARHYERRSAWVEVICHPSVLTDRWTDRQQTTNVNCCCLSFTSTLVSVFHQSCPLSSSSSCFLLSEVTLPLQHWGRLLRSPRLFVCCISLVRISCWDLDPSSQGRENRSDCKIVVTWHITEVGYNEEMDWLMQQHPISEKRWTTKLSIYKHTFYLQWH